MLGKFKVKYNTVLLTYVCINHGGHSSRCVAGSDVPRHARAAVAVGAAGRAQRHGGAGVRRHLAGDCALYADGGSAHGWTRSVHQFI